MLGDLQRQGYQIIDDPESADVVSWQAGTKHSVKAGLNKQDIACSSISYEKFQTTWRARFSLLSLASSMLTLFTFLRDSCQGDAHKEHSFLCIPLQLTFCIRLESEYLKLSPMVVCVEV